MLLSVAVVAAASCHHVERGINVLLVTVDTLRDDHSSVSGYSRPTTPGLEKLARQGARVRLAYAPTATTGPTHASVFTSLYPIAHGVVKNGLVLDDGFETLAETLRAEGYRTAGVVSSFVLDAKFGYGQGFDSYEDDFDPAYASVDRDHFQGEALAGAFDQTAARTTEKAAKVLEQLGAQEKPFFLWVHYFDPHAPYVPPAPFASRFTGDAEAGSLEAAIDAYDGEIAFADRQIGALLEALERTGRRDDTLVIVTSDHGEGLMQHGHMNHGVQIYEEAVRVPLLFRLPGRIAAGAVLEGPVELVDVMPTILGLAGLPAPAGLQGRSLAAALETGVALDSQRPVHLHRRHYEPRQIGDIAVAGEKFGVRVGPWKYIEGEQEQTRELFNLDDDPHERNNLVEESADTAEALRSRIAAWKLAYGRDTTRRQALSPEDLERLKALGYVE